MAINPEGYFNRLRAFLNPDYIVDNGAANKLTLRERIFTEESTRKRELKVELGFTGQAFAVKLDKINTRGNQDRLFHFLDDTGQPWSKRCDFVVFHYSRSSVRAYCFEYKWKSLPDEGIISQLTASVSWCHSLSTTIKNYTNITRRMRVYKYVFSQHDDPSRFLDADNKYLHRDHSIRHYHYGEVDGGRLEDLENETYETV